MRMFPSEHRQLLLDENPSSFASTCIDLNQAIEDGFSLLRSKPDFGCF